LATMGVSPEIAAEEILDELRARGII
jgi:hypothetical protein